MKWIVTGGCGFIGTNVAERLQAQGHEVIVIDNLRRPRVHRNLTFLRDALNIECVVGDVRDASLLHEVFSHHSDATAVLHLAGQVSFLASLRDPRYDFEANAVGTLNVLEATKAHVPNALVIYSSTNKVYGDLTEIATVETKTRFTLPDYPHGLPSDLPLNLSGGYGCSKGAADQLVIDWARYQGLRTVSLRQSSVYGGRQFSTEDQGWAAFFAERFARNEPYEISGTGKQVRDLLHVGDLYRAYLAVATRPDVVTGRAFNIGGGPRSNSSLLELFDRLEGLTSNRPDYTAGPPRPADQKVFIADIRPLEEAVGWLPEIGLTEGLAELVDWVREGG